MGCHTWVYKKVSSLSEKFKEECVSDELDTLKNSRILLDKKEDFIKEMDDFENDMAFCYGCAYSPYTEESYKKDIRSLKRKISKLEKEGFDYLVKLDRHTAKVHVGKNKELYYNIGFDYPFRVYGYPEETFYDKQKLLDWLKEYKDVIGYYNDEDKFVPGYTDELVSRINAHFQIHGISNLYFSFG